MKFARIGAQECNRFQEFSESKVALEDVPKFFYFAYTFCLAVGEKNGAAFVLHVVIEEVFDILGKNNRVFLKLQRQQRDFHPRHVRITAYFSRDDFNRLGMGIFFREDRSTVTWTVLAVPTVSLLLSI